MKLRLLAFDPEVWVDMDRTWSLVAQNDGEKRAHMVYARIEAFCRSLSEIGLGAAVGPASRCAALC